MPQTHVLIAGITEQGDVSIQFTSGIMKIQSQLAKTPDIRLAFEFFTNPNDAASYFLRNKHLDVLVILDTKMSVDPAFLLHHDLSKPFVVPSYPLRNIDWDRVRTHLPNAPDGTDHLAGVTYNYDLETAVPIPGMTYVKIKKAQLRACKFTRAFFDTLQTEHPDIFAEDGSSVALWADAIMDGRRVTADDRVCALWNRDIYADITCQTGNTGLVDYTGCVGTRVSLR